MKRTQGTVWKWILAIAIGLTSTIATAPDAEACGGFFCSNLPMDQAGEEIAFVVDEEYVTAIIKIFYQGEAEDFSWVLPLQAPPEDFGTSSDMVFRQLRDSTTPVLKLSGMWDYPCSGAFDCGWDEEGGETGGDEGGFSEEGDPSAGVTVLDSGQVGPYDYHVVESTDSSALDAWLYENDYEQPPESKPLIASYVEKGFVFIALKLTAGSATGDVVPVALRLPAPEPCIPLVLTQIAAVEGS